MPKCPSRRFEDLLQFLEDRISFRVGAPRPVRGRAHPGHRRDDLCEVRALLPRHLRDHDRGRSGRVVLGSAGDPSAKD